MAKNFKVNVGERNRWFETIDQAQAFCSDYARKHNIILSIVNRNSLARTHYYLGTNHTNEPIREVFASDTLPTSETHSRYSAVTGPFRTKRAAIFMRDHGLGNPHCQTVAQAEMLAARYKHFKGDRFKFQSATS